MAAEEDKKFDAVLGGFLVNDLRVRAGHLHCPESDVLAAYHERSLLPEEMNSWKEHIVGCARCQAILAELEATDSIPIQASAKEEVLLPSAANPVPVAREERDASMAKTPEKPRVASIPRGVRWQWLAPAGALAAGLLVWVAWHENRPLQVKAPTETTTARVEQPATSQRSTTPQAPASPSSEQSRSDQLVALSKDQGAIGGATPAKIVQERKSLKQLEKSDSRARAALAKPSADKDSGAREDAVSELLAANPAQNQPALDNKPVVAGAASQTVEVQAQAANAQLQNQQSQQELNAQKTPGPSPLGHTQQAPQKAKSESRAFAYRAAATPPPAAPSPAAGSSEVSSAHSLVAGVLSPHLVSAPGAKTLWHAGRAGMIAFSSDGGASWSRQTSNVLVDLTTGSAPSDKVCWIVGRAGAILLTTDAGSHWTILHSPLGEDLGGVRAADALHATIWNSLSTKTFATSDSGVTWKAVPPQ